MVTAQLAKLEADRLELKTKILELRSNHLEIKSPIDGVVISGDQERAEGAPLTIGQALFEVAPLDKMVVELAIPEDEITHIKQNFAKSQLDQRRKQYSLIFFSIQLSKLESELKNTFPVCGILVFVYKQKAVSIHP